MRETQATCDLRKAETVLVAEPPNVGCVPLVDKKLPDFELDLPPESQGARFPVRGRQSGAEIQRETRDGVWFAQPGLAFRADLDSSDHLPERQRYGTLIASEQFREIARQRRLHPLARRLDRPHARRRLETTKYLAQPISLRLPLAEACCDRIALAGFHRPKRRVDAALDACQTSASVAKSARFLCTEVRQLGTEQIEDSVDHCRLAILIPNGLQNQFLAERTIYSRAVATQPKGSVRPIMRIPDSR